MDGGIDAGKREEKEEERSWGSRTQTLALVGGCARQKSAEMGPGSGNRGVVE